MKSPERWRIAADGRERERPPFSRKGILALGAIFLLIVGEISLQNLVVQKTLSVQCLPSTWNFPVEPSKTTLITRPTVQEAFEGKVADISKSSTIVSSLRQPSSDYKERNVKTLIEPNQNIKQFGLTGIRNVCMRPTGSIVMVGISEADILSNISKVPALYQEWVSSYNCSKDSGCMGYEVLSQFPTTDVIWVLGTTTHIIPYLNNVFHHFADRVWPHIAGFQYPLNETTPHPLDHFLVHRFRTWLFQAGHNTDRNTLMYMIRILGTLAPKADFLVMDEEESPDDKKLICYERLVLACATCDRISNKLGYNITKPALLRYRNAALSFMGITEEPTIPLPPRPLRVAFYGRGDTRRRRVVNAQEVVRHLSTRRNPPLDVTFIDELMSSGQYNQSLPEVVSLFSQVDVFITIHGANTWAALFMPKHGAVIEIYGPCGPSTWLDTIVNAVELKHDTQSNPWGQVVASPYAGNTTKCEGPLKTPDFTLDLQKLDQAIHGLALPKFGSNDRIPLHWLHNW